MNRDTDGDGLSDRDEVRVHFTSPTNIDTDGDSANDGGEVAIGSDPLKIEVDSDGDSIPNDRELALGTDPANADTDSDTLDDGFEIINRTNPLSRDTDGDGVTDDIDSVNDWYYFFRGGESDDNFGTSVSGAGDVNNDGVVDIVVGAPDGRYIYDSSSVRGTVRLFSGVSGSILRTYYGNSSNDKFGLSVSGVGDFNNDGTSDVIVGAPFAKDRDVFGWSSPGAARVVSGSGGSLFYVDGLSAYSGLAHSVSGAGDVNNDGFADIIIGVPYDDYNGKDSGEARVYSGASGNSLGRYREGSADDHFGWSVSNAGDVNNDGFADFIVGAPRDDNNGVNSGSAWVFSGVDRSILYIFNGDFPYAGFGWSVSNAGDVNGDGFADMIVGAISGGARVFSGVDGSILYTLNDDSENQSVASSVSVSSAGDVNNDRFADFIVGSPHDDKNGFNSGSARVFSGIDGRIIYTINGYGPNDSLGSSVSHLGDIDNDGYADILVGAKGDSSARVISSNGDWDGDGVGTLTDPYPYIYMDDGTDYDSDGLLDVEVAKVGNRLRKYYKLTENGTKETANKLLEMQEFLRTMQHLVNPKFSLE